jgi:hypothetical protein
MSVYISVCPSGRSRSWALSTAPSLPISHPQCVGRRPVLQPISRLPRPIPAQPPPILLLQRGRASTCHQTSRVLSPSLGCGDGAPKHGKPPNDWALFSLRRDGGEDVVAFASSFAPPVTSAHLCVSFCIHVSDFLFYCVGVWVVALPAVFLLQVLHVLATCISQQCYNYGRNITDLTYGMTWGKSVGPRPHESREQKRLPPTNHSHLIP